MIHIRQHPQWKGAIQREDAEMLLHGERIGSYLIREGDQETSLIVNELEQSNGFQMEHALFDYVSGEERISEKLLLHIPEGWLFYEDEPKIRGGHYRFYSTLNGLLQSGAIG